ncbi:UDP-glycosyltransferase [Autumnicola musiva]|uniref:UDP-glycosyltransferase n=1 Tax=Autumnicola musiva TaxID=3075589 RepID=A0ABU3D5I7_9FLAO|nr:UDP-glycosyltransferase [Zunongwangia sp. F117]MDT0676796.1 UDP-glycosyltransferase [Zunongwangia sp. F117]
MKTIGKNWCAIQRTTQNTVSPPKVHPKFFRGPIAFARPTEFCCPTEFACPTELVEVGFEFSEIYIFTVNPKLLKPTSQKKILVVAESIDVEDSSGSKANVALILNLKKAGFEVKVYHYTRKEIDLPGVQCIAIKEKKWNSLFLLSRVQRKIQHGFKVNLAKRLEPVFGFSFTFFNDVRSIAEALRKEKKFKPDIVLTLSKGASFRPHYAMLQVPELQNKWMAYIHDPYPFHYYPEPYNWSEPGYQKKIKFFQELSEKCKWVAFPSLLLKDWMKSKFPKFEGKEVILPHQLIEKENPAELPDFFNSEKFTLLHAGNLMKQRPPFHLINAFQKFLEKVPEAQKNAELLLIGQASYHREKLQKKANKIPQLRINDYLHYETALALQKNVSVNIILEAKTEMSPFLPGKFPHCIAAEKPILLLGPSKSESLRLLGEGYPYWAEVEDEKKIEKHLEDLYRRWLENARDLTMKREDLKSYLSAGYLKAEIEKLFV